MFKSVIESILGFVVLITLSRFLVNATPEPQQNLVQGIGQFAGSALGAAAGSFARETGLNGGRGQGGLGGFGNQFGGSQGQGGLGGFGNQFGGSQGQGGFGNQYRGGQYGGGPGYGGFGGGFPGGGFGRGPLGRPLGGGFFQG